MAKLREGGFGGWNSSNPTLFAGSGASSDAISGGKMARLVPAIDKELKARGSKTDTVLSLRSAAKGEYEGVARVGTEWRRFAATYRNGNLSRLEISDSPTDAILTRGAA